MQRPPTPPKSSRRWLWVLVAVIGSVVIGVFLVACFILFVFVGADRAEQRHADELRQEREVRDELNSFRELAVQIGPAEGSELVSSRVVTDCDEWTEGEVPGAFIEFTYNPEGDYEAFYEDALADAGYRAETVRPRADPTTVAQFHRQDERTLVWLDIDEQSRQVFLTGFPIDPQCP
jgi:hypothetical protein